MISQPMLFYVKKNVSQQAHVLVTRIAQASKLECDSSNRSAASQASSHAIRQSQNYIRLHK